MLDDNLEFSCEACVPHETADDVRGKRIRWTVAGAILTCCMGINAVAAFRLLRDDPSAWAPKQAWSCAAAMVARARSA